MTLEIIGKVTKEEDGTGFVNFRIEIFAIDQMLFDEKVGEVSSKDNGEFRVTLNDANYLNKFGPDYGIYLIVYNTNGAVLTHGRYDQQGKIKWSAKNLVRFEMAFPKNVEFKEPPKFGDLFGDKIL